MKIRQFSGRLSRFVVFLIGMATFVGCSTPVQQEVSSPEGVQLKTIGVNGTTLTYTEHGKGTPVVLVHGTLGDYRTWDGQVGPFSEKYRVFSYSRRDFYPNEFREAGSATSNSIHVEDLKAFIQALNVGPVHLVGHSGGGFISLLYARDNPENLISLTLGEPAATVLLATTSEGTALLQDFGDNVNGPSKAAFQIGDDEEGVRRFIDGVMGRERAFDNLPANFRANMMENARTLRRARLNPSPSPSPSFSCEDASKISTPTLLLHGEYSPRMFVAINDILEPCLPNVERAIIRSSHSLEMENPTAFNETVLSFLAKH